jgi:hypothetical protein
MYGIDQHINLGAQRHRTTTLRQLAFDGRLSLRKSRRERQTGDDTSTAAFMAIVAHPTDENRVEAFPISRIDYADLLAMGVPEEPRAQDRR